MEAQSQIKRALSQPESINSIRRILADAAHVSRSSLARAVCGHFGFVDLRGHAQSAGCLKALRELEQAGHFELPGVAPSGRGKGKTARRLDAPVPAQGRGRQDRAHAAPMSIKDIYMYVLEPQYRALMGVAPPPAPAVLGIAQGLDESQWADQEFGGAELGDQRLNGRLIQSARALGAMPGRAFSGVAQGDRAAVKGCYRLIDKPDDSRANLQAILAPHGRRQLPWPATRRQTGRMVLAEHAPHHVR